MSTLTKKVIPLAVITGLGLGGVAMLAQARESSDNDAVAAASAAITLEQAIGIAKTTVPGMAARAEFSNDDGVAVWEVEIIDAKQAVTDLEIDAATGNVLKQQADDTDHGDRDDNDNDDREDRD